MENLGDVTISGKKYRIQLSSYKEKDLADFAPRASVPGGSASMSELLLYQTLNMTDWRHGLGFIWHTDEMGYKDSAGYLDTRSAGMVQLYPEPTIVTDAGDLKDGLVEFNGDIYSWGTLGLRKWSVSGSAWSSIYNANAVNFALATESYLFFCPNGAQLQYITKVSATPVACGTANATDFKWLIIHNGFIYGSQEGTNEVHYSGADDLTGTLAGEAMEGTADADPNVIKVGGGKMPLIAAITYANELYVMRRDGLWNISSDNKTAKRVLDFSSEMYNYNFSGRAVYNGYLYFSIRNKIYQWNGVRLQDVTPPRLSSSYPFNEFVFYSQMIVLKNNLYVTAMQWDIDDMARYRIFLLSFDGVGWHKLMPLTSSYANTTRPEWMYCTMCYSVDTSYLYMALRYDTTPTALTSSIVYRLAIPSGQLSRGPFPVVSSDLIPGGVLYTSKLDMGYRRVIKSTPSILVEANNVSTDCYLKVGAYFDNQGSAVDFGAITVNGITELYCSDIGTGTDITKEYYNVVFGVGFYTTSSTVTPILEGLTVRFLMRPDVFYGYSFTIIAAQSVVYGNEQDDRSPQDYLTDLRIARDSKSPVEFIDLYGATHTCYISSVSLQAVERHENSNDGSVNIEAYISVNLVEAA